MRVGTYHHTEETKEKIRRALSGEKSPRSRLTALDVHEIRRLYSTGKVTMALLGKMFKVDDNTICSAINRKSWRYI